MSAGELPKITSGASDDSKDFAVERDLEDPPGEGAFSNEKNLVGSGGDADRIGLPNHSGQALARRGDAIDGAGFGIGRYVNRKHAEKFTLGIEHLNAPIGAIAHVEIVIAVGHNGVRQVKLTRPRARLAPGLNPVAILVIFCDAGVDLAVGVVVVSCGVPGYVGGLAKKSVDRR